MEHYLAGSSQETTLPHPYTTSKGGTWCGLLLLQHICFKVHLGSVWCSVWTSVVMNMSACLHVTAWLDICIIWCEYVIMAFIVEQVSLIIEASQWILAPSSHVCILFICITVTQQSHSRHTADTLPEDWSCNMLSKMQFVGNGTENCTKIVSDTLAAAQQPLLTEVGGNRVQIWLLSLGSAQLRDNYFTSLQSFRTSNRVHPRWRK